jgi:hypothetical protein
MFISREHRLIVLRNRKCASTSLVRLFEPFCDVTWRNANEALGADYADIRHANVSEAEHLLTRLGWGLEEWSVVGTVRNPFDRVVSHYHYEKDVIRNPGLKDMEFCGYVCSLWFKNFARKNSWEVFSGNAEGSLQLTHVLRVENLLGDLAGLPFEFVSRFPRSAPRLNTTQRQTYRKYFGRSERLAVEEAFRMDLEVGGYVF